MHRLKAIENLHRSILDIFCSTDSVSFGRHYIEELIEFGLRFTRARKRSFSNSDKKRSPLITRLDNSYKLPAFVANKNYCILRWVFEALSELVVSSE